MIRDIRASWAGAVLVCGKCSKKMGGGFGKDGRVSLAKALRKDLRLKKGRKGSLGVVETKCLGLCPKNAVAVVGADTAQWHVVPAGTDLDAVKAAVLDVA